MFSSAAFSTPALYQRPLNTKHCIYVSLKKLDNEELTRYDCEIVHCMHIHTVNFSAPAAQRISQVKSLVKSAGLLAPKS